MSVAEALGALAPEHGDEVLALMRACATVTLQVTTGSMRPALAPGERVVVMPCAAGALRVGDIAAFAAPSGVIVHRVLARLAGGRLLVRGDAVRAADEPVAAERILGRVVAVASAAGAVRRLDGRAARVSGSLAALAGSAHVFAAWGASALLRACRGQPAPVRPGKVTRPSRR